MDEPDVDSAELHDSLRFIRRVNRFFGYTRAVIRHLERFSRSWQPRQRIDIIDLATGSADIPRAILRWAERKGFDIHIVGVDRHAETARLAARESEDDLKLRIVQADALDPPFAGASFDYALCAMFLHHLDDGAAVRVLKNMDRLSRRGMIASDLLRHRRAYLWIRLFTAASNPIIRHDAAVSVRQSFSRDEVLDLRSAAGVEYAEYYGHFGHRWALAGQKPPRADSETGIHWPIK